MGRGLIYLFTGEGKGKTSAALGVGVRAALAGKRVAMVCWYKEKAWKISEAEIGRKLKNFRIFLLGKGFYLKKLRAKSVGYRAEGIEQRTGWGGITDKASEAEHKTAAGKALEKAGKLINSTDVLVLDEVCNAINDGLIEVGQVLELLKKRGKTHIILTGRGADKKLVEAADLVTEMKKVKHPFDKGVKAVRGLDY